MKKRPVLGIVAHVDAGKTTLSEAMLYTCGSIRKLGRVDNRDAFLDTDEQERARGITIFSKQARFSYQDMDITLLDTPGHVDFSAEMERTLQVLDYAVLVVSGPSGVQGHTTTLWKLLQRYQIPTFIFVNKMDCPGTDREVLMKHLKKELTTGCVDFTDSSTDVFAEEIAVQDEVVLEKVLEGTWECVPDTEIQRLIVERKVFPCLFGSALKVQGVEELLSLMDRFIVNRYEKNGEPFGARVYKIGRDEQDQRLTYLKVTGGVLQVKDVVEGEKVNQIRLYSGDKFETVNQVVAGQVCAVTGLTGTKPGQGLGTEEGTNVPVLEPVMTYKLELPDDTSPIQMLPKMKKLEEEIPELHVLWQEELQEIQVQVMGSVQIEILKNLIAKRFQIGVQFGTGKIVYKETIVNTVEGVGHFEPLRHYAEVHLLMEPGEPGSGLQFAAAVSEDLLDKNWQRLILTHLEEKEHRGVLLGAPITDMRITLVAGKAHLKHTEGGDFRQATYRAVRHGLMQADSVLLEPCYAFRLELPTENVGRAMNDIQNMHGTFTLEETDSAGNLSVITGKAPVSCMQDYQTKVTAYTGGQGHITCEPAGYQVCHNTEEVLAKSIYDPERDMRNPASSVFCAHGAGFVVEWDSVEFFMHVDSGLMLLQPPIDPEERVIGRARESFDYDSIGTEEIDEIIAKSSSANRRPDSNRRIGWNGKQRTGVKRISAVTGNNRQGDNKFSADGATGGLQNEGSRKTKAKPQVKKSAYLLVDGYNVIFAWNSLKALAAVNIDSARDRLLDILSNYQGMKGVEVIVVFDAYRVTGHKTEYFDYHNIHVVYTREAETADRYIERFAHENNEKYDITVATSDGLEQIIIRGAGCRLLSSRDLETEIEKANHAFREAYMSNSPSLLNYLMDYFPEGMDS